KVPDYSSEGVAQAAKEGRLDDSFVEEATMAGRRETVISALAALANVQEDTARRILLSGSAKAVTSLIWRAGLSMRVAFKVQTSLMRLPAGDLLPARGGI